MTESRRTFEIDPAAAGWPGTVGAVAVRQLRLPVTDPDGFLAALGA